MALRRAPGARLLPLGSFADRHRPRPSARGRDRPRSLAAPVGRRLAAGLEPAGPRVVRRRRWPGRALAMGDPPGVAGAQMVGDMKATFAIPLSLAVTLAACTGAPPGPQQPKSVATSAQIVSPTTAPANPLSAVRHPIGSLRPRVIAEIGVGGPLAPDWQVSAYGSVWVANSPKNSIQRIDARTNRVIATIPLNDPCDGLAAGFGSIWAPGCAAELVTRIDASTNTVVARIHAHIFGEGEGL